MRKELKTRTRADRFQNDVRARRPTGKYLYLTLISLLFGYIAKLIFGSYLWLDAGGIVTAQRVVIAPPYDAQVLKLHVTPGTELEKGQAIGAVHSPHVVETVAALSARYAETYARQAELSVRMDIAKAMLKLAGERVGDSETMLRKLAGNRNVVNEMAYFTAVRERYTSLAEKVMRETELKSATTQIAKLQQAQDDARTALADIKSRYQDGQLIAPIAGTVGSEVPQQGEVLKSGDTLLEIYGNDRYCLGYVEPGAFYAIKVGAPVTIGDGTHRTSGHIAEIMPITVQLPPEFQKTFKPRERGQIIKVVMDGPNPFPLLATVRIESASLMPMLDRFAQWQQMLTGTDEGDQTAP